MADDEREVLTWSDFGSASRDLALDVIRSGFEAEVVVAIARGGLLLAGGIAFHLHHPAASRQALEHNQALYARTLAERRLRSERGLDEHQPGP